MDYNEIVDRVGYFREKAGLSQRELSQRLGYNPQFIETIETKRVQLKISTLLDICNIVGVTIFDFFYLGKKYNEERKEFLDLFLSLSDDKKDAVIKLLKSN